MGRVLDKGGVGKTEDSKGGCTVMDKACDIMDKGEDNYTSGDILDNKNDDVGLSKIMDKLEKNSNMTNISSIRTTTSSTDAHSTFGTYSTYNTIDGYALCKILEADSCQRERGTDISKDKSLEDPKEITTELGQKNIQISNGGKCTSSHEVHPPREQRPVLSASSSNATVIIMDEDNGGSENHKDVHLVNHSKLQGPPDVERILTEIQMINYLIENEEEDASAFVGNNKINCYSSTVESFSYEDSLGKYQKLPAIGRVPHITLSDKYAENQPRISSSDKSTNSRDAPSMVTPKSTRSNTVNVPNSSINEKKNQNRLVNKLEPERLTADEKKSYIQPKIKLSSSNIKSTLPKIKSSSQNINTALPKIQSGKIKSFSGNNHFVLPKIKPSSENISSGNTNSTLPKIKTASAKDYIKRNNKMAMKIKTPVLPNIMKSIPTIPKVYKPTPPTVKPTNKRPYTGKYRKLPPILDLNAELEKQNTFKDT
ncbi:hypothetical protein SNE40_023548 [Patella caerulea]|uniref:Uncharacterized protein n=1 Tax=Patella caerulea TaxID=87958 RepID=A0AAN8IYT0_PATCE